MVQLQQGFLPIPSGQLNNGLNGSDEMMGGQTNYGSRMNVYNHGHQSQQQTNLLMSQSMSMADSHN